MAQSTELRVFSRYIEWKIPKFFDLPYQDDYYCKSSTFYLTGFEQKWWLTIYPKVSCLSKVVFVKLCLYKGASETKYEVNFRMGIRNTDGSEFESVKMEKTFQAEEDYWAVYFPRSKLSSARADVAADGTLTFFCSVKDVGEQIPSSVATEKYHSQISSAKVIEAASQTSSSEGVSDLIESFKDMYISKRSADIKIKVKGREFLAHTFILTARSKVFCSMFSNDMVEKNSGIVEITDCDPDSFDDFLLFLYTGDSEVVSSRNAVSLYKTADKYDLKGLRKECVLRMINEMNLDSFCDVLHLAAMYNETEILMAATKFFIENAKSILLTTKWANFMADNFTLGNELVLKFVEKNSKN